MSESSTYSDREQVEYEEDEQRGNQKSITEKANPAQTKEALKRHAYLIGQTDVFRHFLKLKGVSDDDITTNSKTSSKEKANEAKDKRRRKTEKEEDAELISKNAEDNETAAITETPFYVKGKMRDYQIAGLNWLVSLYDNGINGILADEMGLGKTLQSISFLGYLKHYKNVDGPHLVVVPKSTLHNWMSEFARWVPTIKVILFHGTKEERAVFAKETLLPGKWDVCVTSYEMCLMEKAHLKKFAFQYIVIDEAHRIKNENSLLSQIVRVFNTRNRLLLTGTPLQNNLHELWALLNFLLPDVFSSSEDFDSWFQIQGGDQDKVVSQLHKVLRPFLLRRLKSDVEKSLLPKKEINVYVGLSDMQRKWYQKLLEKDIDAVNGGTGKKESKTRLLNIVMQLRKCCNHPYLFDGAEPGPPYTTDQHLCDNAGKMVVLNKLLGKLQAQGSRVLIFSQMSRILDILEDYCGWKGYKYCRIDGSTAHEDRISAIDDYNRPGSEKFIFLLTTRAGGLGINLTSADIVVLYDSDWNPQSDLQAMDRAHRIGQTKQVVVFRFITEESVEEKVLERAASKLRLDQLVIQQGRTQVNKGVSNSELLSMIQHGAANVFEGKGAMDYDEDIDAIISRGENKSKELHNKFTSMGLDDLQNFSLDSAYTWEGENYGDKKRKVGLNWIQPAKRERKMNYSVDNYYKEAMNNGKPKDKENASKAPKPPKQIAINDFQFYPPRLAELQEKEVYAYRRSVEYKVPRPEGEDDETAEQLRQTEQLKIESAEPLTEEEMLEKDTLASQGFDNWNKRDFTTFIKGCEKYGRKEEAQIAAEMEGKSLADVKEYCQTFWARYTEILGHEKIIENIERGEAKLAKNAEMQDHLLQKVNSYRNPLAQLRIQYTQNKGKHWTEEEDRFLIVQLAQLGYGGEDVYDLIRREVRKTNMFKFNFHVKSRTVDEIRRRCTTLMSLIAKEMEAEAELARSEKKKRKEPDSATTGSAAKAKKVSKPLKNAV